MRKLSKVEAAYLAGLIDGEGCIGIHYHTSGYKYYYARLAISMTAKSVIQWVYSTTKVGSIHRNSRTPKKKNWKRGFTWCVASKQAAELLKELIPFLKLKRKQAKILLEFQSRMFRPGLYGHTRSYISFQKKCASKMKKLNKRGK